MASSYKHKSAKVAHKKLGKKVVSKGTVVGQRDDPCDLWAGPIEADDIAYSTHCSSDFKPTPCDDLGIGMNGGFLWGAFGRCLRPF